FSFFFWCVSLCVFCFFFFQAEDGIRDDLVTGVQTCALPIFISRRLAWWLGPSGMVIAGAVLGWFLLHDASPRDPLAGATFKRLRSEERRVGKECRAGWARAALKETDEAARHTQEA